MATETRIFKTEDCVDSYSRLSWLDPIFKWEPYYFRGDIGQYRDIEVFLKNTGDTILTDDSPENPLEIYIFEI